MADAVSEFFGEITGQSCPKPLFRPKQPSTRAHATLRISLAYCGPLPLPVAVPRFSTQLLSRGPLRCPAAFPSPTLLLPFSRAALPSSAPHRVLPAPILLGRESPPVAAAARSEASAARSRAVRAMTGGDGGGTPGSVLARWRWAHRPARSTAGRPAFQLAAHSLSLGE